MKHHLRFVLANRSTWAALGLIAIGAVYSLEYLGLSSRWWFEDDPALFAYTAGIGNPARFFTDPGVLRHFTGGAALVPMQLFSYWIDVKLAGFSPEFAYAHQVCSFLLTLLLLYLILARWLQSRIAAVAVSAIWAVLPATAVVVQFAATRHYLEGLLFSLLAIYLSERLRSINGRLGVLAQASVLLCASIALLYKEIYAPVLPLLLLLSAWRHRERRFALLTVAMAWLYAIYRLWVFGPTLRYGDMPVLSGMQYLRFLSKFPYTFASNYGGYLLCGIVVVLGVYAVKRGSQSAIPVWCFLAVFAFSLAAIVPVSYPLYFTIRRPDPWYRIVFLPHTITLLFAGYLAARCTSGKAQAMLALAALLGFFPASKRRVNSGPG